MQPPPATPPVPMEALRDHLVAVAAQASDLHEVVAALGEGLHKAGYAPGRVNLAVLTLHPSLAGMGFAWRGDTRTIEAHQRPWGFLDTPEHRESPLAAVMSTRRALRLDLTAGEGDAFAITRGFAAAGATAYVALPMPTRRGDVHVLTVWTTRAGGWTASEHAGFTTLLPTLGLIVELFESRRLSRTVVETYLGPRTGPRVLAGHIHRGTSERIPAAVWFSDVRSFTDLTREHGDEATVQALDVWFELAVDAVQSRGGEVLKFIGDALLAIFPVENGNWTEAVDTSVRAALAIHSREERQAHRSGLALRSGVAIHTGEVLYGNVGAPGRLDFTVLGSAVNKAARLSGLCGSLGESILLSARAAESYSGARREVGSFPLKGFLGATPVYAPTLIADGTSAG